MRRPRPRDELLVALAFASTIVCVVGAGSLVDVRMTDIGRHSHAISDRAIPAIVALTRLRARLRELRRSIAYGAAHSASDPSVLASELEALETEGRRYEAIQQAGGELPTWTRCRDTLATLRTNVQAAGLSDPIAQAKVDPASLNPWTDIADARVEDLLSSSYRTLGDEVAAIDGVRAGTVRREHALYGTTLLIALVLVALSLHLLSKHRRSVAGHIDELEAFAARVAHDLRSPLMPAMLALQRAAGHVPVSDPIRPVLLRGERSLHTLERIVEGLLAFAVSGIPSEAGASTSVDETMDAVLSEQLDLAFGNQVTLSVRCDSSMHVACSQGVLASVVGNLVSNAIKFIGNSQDRRVDIHALRTGDRACIEVADTGPGVPRDQEPRMFDAYVHGHTAGSGLGLGLATVKRLVSAHGGDVEYRRRVPNGSIFRIELPLAVQTERK
ncbi:MAG TPA: HAMP domain-containing sensor histidine kinase [Polyangiaceae bacterium]|nr:HAMP domain-containing sensor histidine kinase [Polyangiaceae bacterium]